MLPPWAVQDDGVRATDIFLWRQVTAGLHGSTALKICCNITVPTNLTVAPSWVPYQSDSAASIDGNAKEERQHIVLQSTWDGLYFGQGLTDHQDEDLPFLSSQALWSCARHCESDWRQQEGLAMHSHTSIHSRPRHCVG